MTAKIYYELFIDGNYSKLYLATGQIRLMVMTVFFHWAAPLVISKLITLQCGFWKLVFVMCSKLVICWSSILSSQYLDQATIIIRLSCHPSFLNDLVSYEEDDDDTENTVVWKETTSSDSGSFLLRVQSSGWSVRTEHQATFHVIQFSSRSQLPWLNHYVVFAPSFWGFTFSFVRVIFRWNQIEQVKGEGCQNREIGLQTHSWSSQLFSEKFSIL